MRLATFAPVTAIHGKIDKGTWAEELPATEATVFGDPYLYVLHDLKSMISIYGLLVAVP